VHCTVLLHMLAINPRMHGNMSAEGSGGGNDDDTIDGVQVCDFEISRWPITAQNFPTEMQLCADFNLPATEKLCNEFWAADDNIGAVMRSSALEADGLLLLPSACDETSSRQLRR